MQDNQRVIGQNLFKSEQLVLLFFFWARTMFGFDMGHQKHEVHHYKIRNPPCYEYIVHSAVPFCLVSSSMTISEQ